MAALGLDHLKNDYRRRFCQPSRAPNICTEQGQNMLEILQECFEEKSFINDLITHSTESVLYSTPKGKDSGIQSPSKECQISNPKSVPISSRKKDTSLQGIVEPCEAASRSVQIHDVRQKILGADVGSKSTPDLKKKSSEKLNSHHSKADEEFYLSVGSPVVLLDAKACILQNAIPSVAQKRETYTSGNSISSLSSSAEICLKTKKRLNFEDKDVLKKVEIESKVSDIEDKISKGQQEKNPSETSQKRVQDLEYEIQPQVRKSFSTLFSETVKRKSESSPVVRHIASIPPHSSPSNDMKLEDEFIIDESDRSFADRPWITIPRKGKLLKRHVVSPSESTPLLQRKKSREKPHSTSPITLTSDKHAHNAHPGEKSQPSGDHNLGTSCALTAELENDCKSTKYEMYSENAKKPSRNKRTRKQKQRRLPKAKVVEENLTVGQCKDENRNMSHIPQDKLQKNLERNVEHSEKMRSGRISPKQMLPVGSKKKKSTKKEKEKSRKKRFSNESKNEFVPEEVTSTVMRSRRISRRPSNWWVVKPEESPVHRSSSIRNELSTFNNSRQKLTKKTNQSSKNIGEKTIPSKRLKRTSQSSSKVQQFLSARGSEGIDHHETSGCSLSEPLESDKAALAKKKNLDSSGTTGYPKKQDGIMIAQSIHLKSQTSEYTCKTPTESNLDSGEPKISVLEESGPSRVKNVFTSGNNNSDVGDKEIQESLDDLRGRRCNMTPDKKIHHKIVLPSNTPNVRRTKRIRLKPLEYWRGERIDYQERPSGGFVIGGILSPDTVPPKRKAKGNMGKINTITDTKRICLDNDKRKNRLVVNLDIPLGDPLQPTLVKDPETREIILMDIVKPRDTYQYFVEHGELKVYKTLDTPTFSTGKLILGPWEEKGKQHVGQDILIFYVNFGDLLCTLHETPYIVTTGDSFYVPSGNYYNIKNLLNEESVLLFTQIKR